LLILLSSFYSIGPTQVGLVRKRFGAKLPGDSPVATKGEAGYQADLLMPGLRFKLSLVYAVTKHPWVQVPAGYIGVVISQVGEALPIGAKSAVYKTGVREFRRCAGVYGERRTKRRPEAGAIAGHAGADSSRGVPGDHQGGGIWRFRLRGFPRAGAAFERRHDPDHIHHFAAFSGPRRDSRYF